MRLAVVGSGPSAFYTVKYFLKSFKNKSSLKIDMFERSNEPYGLVRFGVAPDHPEVKNVTNEFADLLKQYPSQLSLHCGVEIPRDKLGFDFFRKSYDGVLIASGAQSAKLAPISPSNSFTPHITARDFVLWYNTHPDLINLTLPPTPPRTVSVFGMGNVALDVARILSKSPSDLTPMLSHGLNPSALAYLSLRQLQFDQKIVEIQGRKGYPEAAFSNKELRELLHIPGCLAVIDPSDLGASLSDLEISTRENRSKSRGLEIINEMVGNFEKRGKFENLIKIKFNTQPEPKDLAISAIGFKVGEDYGLRLNEDGGLNRGDEKGIFLAGWAKRGPRGTIAAAIPCAIETAKEMVSLYS